MSALNWTMGIIGIILIAIAGGIYYSSRDIKDNEEFEKRMVAAALFGEVGFLLLLLVLIQDPRVVDTMGSVAMVL
jgi:hypothetical protein